MRNIKSTPSRASDYVLPSAAYQVLAGTRDHLRLLAQLTEPLGEKNLDVLYLSAYALADCFDRLAEDLDSVVKAAASPVR